MKFLVSSAHLWVDAAKGSAISGLTKTRSWQAAPTRTYQPMQCKIMQNSFSPKPSNWTVQPLESSVSYMTDPIWEMRSFHRRFWKRSSALDSIWHTRKAERPSYPWGNCGQFGALFDHLGAGRQRSATGRDALIARSMHTGSSNPTSVLLVASYLPQLTNLDSGGE